MTIRPKEHVYNSHSLYFVSCTTNYGGVNPICMSNNSMVLSWHVINTTQPFNIPRLAFTVPCANNNTLHQIKPPSPMPPPNSPPNSPSCCSPSSCCCCHYPSPPLAAQMGVPSLYTSRIRRCCLCVWTTVNFDIPPGVDSPRGSGEKKKRDPTGLVVFPPGRTISAKKKIPPRGGNPEEYGK